MKRIPPFGKPLYDLQQGGHRPVNSIYLWIGSKAWKKGRHFANSMSQRTLVLPPWESAIAYHWPVIGCDILIHDTGFAELDYIEEVVYCLYKDGADTVRCLTPDFSLTVYHKE